MTYDEFLAKLRETPREWTLDKQGQIRLGEQCPITAIHDLGWGAVCALDSAKLLRFSTHASRVIRAADALAPYPRHIRRDLLDACGLTESR